MTQPYPPGQQPNPQWGQPQGWPAPPPQQGWNRAPQQNFGQPAWPQPPGHQQPGFQQSGFQQGGFQQPGFQQGGFQPPAGYPQQGAPQQYGAPQPQYPQQPQQGGYRQPGYPPQPGSFAPPPPAPRRGGGGLGRILILAVAVCGFLLIGVVLANMLNGTPGAGPRPTETYTPPPPEMNPPALPVPKTYGEATDWMQNNPLYQQSITIPTDCNNLQPIDALNATEEELQNHLQELTACLMKVWQAPVEAAGFQLPRPPATVYNQPIQTACGKLDSVNASYCGGDQRIYYAKPLPKIFPKDIQGQKFLMEMVLGHEFGHAIQARTGISISSSAWEQRVSSKAEANVFSRRLEVQADCLAGMWIQAVGPSQGLGSNDLDGLRKVAYNLGDDVLSGKPNIDSGHGLGATRQRWFETGLTGGPGVGQCNTYTVPSGQVR